MRELNQQRELISKDNPTISKYQDRERTTPIFFILFVAKIDPFCKLEDYLLKEKPLRRASAEKKWVDEMLYQAKPRSNDEREHAHGEASAQLTTSKKRKSTSAVF